MGVVLRLVFGPGDALYLGGNISAANVMWHCALWALSWELVFCDASGRLAFDDAVSFGH